MFTFPCHPSAPPTPQTYTWTQSEVGTPAKQLVGLSCAVIGLCHCLILWVFPWVGMPRKLPVTYGPKYRFKRLRFTIIKTILKNVPTVGWKTVSRETRILRMFSVMTGSLEQGLTSSLGINIIRIHVLRTVNIPTHNIIAAPSALGSRKCFQPFLFKHHSPLTVSYASKSAALAGLKTRREPTKRLHCGPASLFASFERPRDQEEWILPALGSVLRGFICLCSVHLCIPSKKRILGPHE